MKKLLILCIVMFSVSAFSQSGFKHLTVKGGFTYYNGASNFEIGLEFNEPYFKNWNLFFSGYQNGMIKNWNVGLYFEPGVLASKNSFLNMKFGTSFGTNQESFIMDIIFGLEYNYAISENFKVGVFFKNNHMFNSVVKFRHALLFGIKYRL